MKNLDIEKSVMEMPPISTNTLQILNLVSNANYKISEFAKLISLDVSLTAKCLQIVNSASIGLRNQINSIERAVNYLGKRTILGLMINSNFNGIFSTELSGYEAKNGDLWNHSLRTAIAAKVLGEHLNDSELGEVAYTAGLLHDIGKVIINQYLSGENHWGEILENAGPEIDFTSLEEELLNTDHAKVGELIARKWGLPESLQYAIGYHHFPGKAPEKYQTLCVLVHLGEHLSMMGGFGTGIDTLSYKIDPIAKNVIDFTLAEMSNILIMIDEEFCNSQDLLQGGKGEKDV